jgi:hypothetical protein
MSEVTYIFGLRIEMKRERKVYQQNGSLDDFSVLYLSDEGTL